VNLKLTIEELVLQGLAQGEETAVLAALEAELARLFGDAPPAGLKAGPLALPPITVAPHAAATAVGQQIGQMIYGGLSHEPTGSHSDT